MHACRWGSTTVDMIHERRACCDFVIRLCAVGKIRLAWLVGYRCTRCKCCWWTTWLLDVYSRYWAEYFSLWSFLWRGLFMSPPLFIRINVVGLFWGTVKPTNLTRKNGIAIKKHVSTLMLVIRLLILEDFCKHPPSFDVGLSKDSLSECRTTGNSNASSKFWTQ